MSSAVPWDLDNGGKLCGASSSATDGSSGKVEADFRDGQLPIFDETIAAYPVAPTRLFGQLSFPKLAPDSDAYQFTGTIDGLAVTLDIFIALKSTQVVLDAYGALGDSDTSQLTSFANQSLAKIP